MYWILLCWAFYQFLGCFAHLQSGSASYPRLTALEAFVNVYIGAWALHNLLNQG